MLQIRLGDHTFDLDHEPAAPPAKTARITLNGTPVEVRMEHLGPQTVLLMLDGRPHVLTIEQNGSRAAITAGGHVLHAEVKDETALLLERFGFDDASAAAEREIRAPMPGLVLRVLAEPGQPVQEGQGLVVLEAMKMENELRAAGSGTVAAVHVAPGAVVGKNDLLIELE
jgi:biotin carboxyl carrier protein